MNPDSVRPPRRSEIYAHTKYNPYENDMAFFADRTAFCGLCGQAAGYVEACVRDGLHRNGGRNRRAVRRYAASQGQFYQTMPFGRLRRSAFPPRDRRVRRARRRSRQSETGTRRALRRQRRGIYGSGRNTFRAFQQAGSVDRCEGRRRDESGTSLGRNPVLLRSGT